MNSSFYTAATGAIQYKNGVDVLANNIANVNTQGYQASGVSFSSLLYTNMRDSADAASALQAGHGAKLSQTDILFEQGTLQQTGNTLDFALTGDGLFAVQTTEGIKFTRNGSTQLVDIDGTFYLGSTLGGIILDAEYQPIEVANGISVEDQNFDLGVFQFANEGGLIRDGGSFYVASTTSGTVATIENADVKRGYVEASSVDLSSEIASVIECQKAFEFCSRMVQMSDEVMQTVNNLR